MLLLPLLYLGLIALTAAGVWWHGTANVWLLSGRSGGQVRLLAYVTPLVAGVVLMFFIVKPILARPPHDTGRCRSTKPTSARSSPSSTRRPQRVQVDCKVNASAGLMDSRVLRLYFDLIGHVAAGALREESQRSA